MSGLEGPSVSLRSKGGSRFFLWLALTAQPPTTLSQLQRRAGKGRGRVGGLRDAAQPAAVGLRLLQLESHLHHTVSAPGGVDGKGPQERTTTRPL